MPRGENTVPTKVVRSDGVLTTVHKGKTNNARQRARDIKTIAAAAPYDLELRAGRTFSAVVNDGVFKFEIESVRNGVVTAVCEPNNEWGIDTKVFTVEEVVSSIKREAVFERYSNVDREFWDGAEDGEILHYHNGFGQFVRCEVYTNEADGEKYMRPIALVGDWHSRDLAYRDSTGEVRYGYHARSIIEPKEGKNWRSQLGNIYELMDDEQRAKYQDPAGCEPVSLEVPEPTDEDKLVYALNNFKSTRLSSEAISGKGQADLAQYLREIATELENLTP